MPRCDGCGNDRCSCVLVDGQNTTVGGAGSASDPFHVDVDLEGVAGASRITGEMIAYAGGTPPGGWLLCDGSAVSRTTYAALFAVCGTTYGAGNGTTTFNLPDVAGRFALGADSSHARGSQAGVETIELTTGNLPPHTHTQSHTHAMGHDHDMSHYHLVPHDHGGATGSAGAVGDHHHTVNQSDTDGSNNATFRRGASNDRQVNTGDAGSHAAHAHSIANYEGGTQLDLPTAGRTGTDSRAGVTGTPSLPNTGSTGSGTAYTNMPPYTAVSWIIKT